MRIDNRTEWDTADLRKIFSRVLARWNRIDRKVPSKRLRVIVDGARQGRGPSGCAFIGGRWLNIRLPNPSHGKLDVKSIGFVFEHEVAHCAGYEHKAMGALNDWATASGPRYDYLADLSVGRAPPPKAKPDKQIERYRRAQARVKSWQTKAKRAATGLAKAKRDVAYYERALTANGKMAALE